MRLRPFPLSRRATAALGELAAAGGLLLATWALYRGVLGLFWLSDDFFNLRWVHAWGPADYALEPEVWRQLPFRMLTPLLFASYDLDLTLFGPRPRPFYVHQLLAIGLAAAALYALLRQWLPRGWALFGGWLFLAGAPVLSLAPLVMVRHYPECVLLAAASAWAWVAALRSPRQVAAHAWAGASGLLWLLAGLAKEIAVPLVLVLPLLPEGEVGRRLRLLWPHAVAASLYVAYRGYLLGTLGGGYGWVIAPEDRVDFLLGLPGRLGAELLGAPSAAGALALGIALSGTLLAASRGRWPALLVGLAVALAVLPVVPVAREMVPRYAVALWVALAMACPFGLRRRRGGAVLAVAGALALLIANRATWDREMRRYTRMSAEYRGLLELPAGAALRHSIAPAASLREVGRFAEALLGRPAPARWFADDLYLCAPRRLPRQLWQYDDRAGRLVERTDELPALRRRHCRALRAHAPLAVELWREGAVLHWRLGAGSEGRYAFVFEDGVSAFEVPAAGAFHAGTAGPGPFRVRYDAPAGWITYSPELRLPAGDARLSWERPPPAGSPQPTGRQPRARAPRAPADGEARPSAPGGGRPATPPVG